MAKEGKMVAAPAERGEKQAPLPDFVPVPRKYRHDGWTPERQKAFIEALADTGCVTRAAAMVNIAQTNAYALRRAPGAEGFRRAWDAALDMGLKRLKDIAFERAIEGTLIPVFVAGKLIGFRRKYNDALLMFCLRHYGEDASGKRTTINYFSTRATSTSSGQASAAAVSVGAGEGPPPPHFVRSPSPSRGGSAEASATTVRTVISGPGAGRGQAGAERDDAAAAALNAFEGVALDAEAAAAIRAALEACAARSRAAGAALEAGGQAAADAAEDDPETPFFRSADPYHGTLEPPAVFEEVLPFVPGEASWRDAGAEMPDELVRFLERMEARAAAEGRGEGAEAERGDE